MAVEHAAVGQPTIEDLMARIRELEAQRNQEAGSPTIKISTKGTGTISWYGLGRFPVSLFASQWVTVIEKIQYMHKFLLSHVDEIAFKDEDSKASIVARLKAVKFGL